MNPKEYQKMKELKNTYWWHVGRRFIILTIMLKHFKNFINHRKRIILDAGCGTGGNLTILKKFGKVIGVDESRNALQRVEKEEFSKLVLGEVTKLPFPDNFFDCVTLFDVLEHIENDELALRECLRVLKAGAAFMLTVPAYQWLWSGHDEALNHKRRYTKYGIIEKMKKVGFDIRFASYMTTLLFPLMALYRLLKRKLKNQKEASYVRFPLFINNLFIILLRLEAIALWLRITFPFGMSIIVYAKKPTSVSR